MLVRILTENKNYPDVLAAIDNYFDGATVIKADGLCPQNGLRWEHTLIIELDSFGQEKPEFSFSDRIKALCFDIKRLNKQDKILVQYINCNSMLI